MTTVFDATRRQPIRTVPCGRTEDRTAVHRQIVRWHQLRTDQRLRREQLRLLQLHRADRADLIQFDVLPDGDGQEVLAVRGELLVRREELASTAIRGFLSDWGLEIVPVGCLAGRVARIVGPPDAGLLEVLVRDVRARCLPISVSHVTPMGVVIKGCTGPTPIADGPGFPSTSVHSDGTCPTVAVLDTGISSQSRSDGWLQGLVTPDNVDRLDAIPHNGELDPGAGHGTFAAGIVQQVAPDAEVRAYRVMDSAGVGGEVQVACALLKAAADGADIINLSLGTQSVHDRPPVALEAALELMAERYPDVLVVAAAGNDGETRPCWPAAFPDVVSVAGLASDLAPTEWSNQGDWVTCAAVGEGIVSTYVEGRRRGADGDVPAVFGADAWASWTGTSFAAPQVAGAVAALCADDPATTPRQALASLLADGRPTRGFGQALQILPGA